MPGFKFRRISRILEDKIFCFIRIMSDTPSLIADVIALSPDGRGIVKTDEKVIFIPLAIPGQKIRFRICGRKKKAYFGEVLEVLESSPYQHSAPDPEFPQHGGAPWQQINYKEQLKWKQQFGEDALQRIGKVEVSQIDSIVESPEEWRYRNKMEFSFGYESMKTEYLENGEKKHIDTDPGLGLHKRGNWREIVRVTDCCIAPEEMMKIRKIVEEFALQTDLPVWNPLARKGFWRNLLLRQSQRTGEILINIFVTESKEDAFWKPLLSQLQKEIPGIVGILETVHDGVSVASFDAPKRLLFGRDHFYEIFSDLKCKISAEAFFQVNTPSAEKLVDTIAEFAELTGKERVLDLFCGAGTLGLSVAKKAKEIVGVEIIPSAIADAKDNAERNGITNASFYAGAVEHILPQILEERKEFDTVIVDPPRAGLPKKARKTLANIPANKIIMVSCNPATLARDMAELEPLGWKAERIRAHDLFPQTPHVETVGLMVRSGEINKTPEV